MSAPDHLSPTQFFHATHLDLNPGDRLVPPGKRRDKVTYEHPQGEMWRNNRVWMTSDPENAAGWMEHHDAPKVYEVQPLGVRKHQSTDYDFTGAPESVGDYEDQYQARGAVVLRRHQ